MSSRDRATAVLSTAGTVVASAMLIRSIVNDFVPDEVRDYLTSSLRFISQHFSREFTIKIEEFRGFSPNQVFEAATVYLETITVVSARRAKVGKDENEKSIVVGADADEEIEDVFENVKLKWRSVYTKVDASGSGWRNRNQNQNHTKSNGDLNASLRSEVRSYELSFHRKHKAAVLERYLPYIMERSRVTKESRKAVKLHMPAYGEGWDQSTVLQHPMSFETLALDPKLKTTVVEDLENFVAGKDYYQKIGKAWKRGYLLYGPPGTGKSSLIAAMANHLNFDIYDLDLSSVHDNIHLKILMLGMSSRSMLVVEDIDCSVPIQNRQLEDDEVNSNSKVTLSGLLNFVDGLWSCCKEARIIVFTTNHPERLDPALLRPGRMDVHICLSYCTVAVFRQLAANYLGIKANPLFEEIEPLVEAAKVTPAEVGGELMKCREPEASLRGLVDFLRNKIKVQEEQNTNKEN